LRYICRKNIFKMETNFFSYEHLKTFLVSSAVVRLLKKENAALIISFLFREFKQTNNFSSISKNYDLVRRLSEFLYEINEVEEMAEAEEKAKNYIEEWSNNGIILQYPSNTTDEKLHELTPTTEKAILIVESLKPREFVGMESRFSDILNRLNNVVRESTTEPEQKIQELEQEKQKIQEKIDKIKNGEKIETLTEIQLLERYNEIVNNTKELLSDFREVEQNFKKIAKEIYNQQIDNFNKERKILKGKILEFVLDESYKLKESLQGKSFYAFWNYLAQSSEERNIYTLANDVLKILNERNIPVQDKFLQNIRFFLFKEGQKIVKANNSMMEKLSKVLTTKNLTEHLKEIELTKEIQQLAMKLVENPPKNDHFFEIEFRPDINLLLDRPAQFNEPEEEMLYESEIKENFLQQNETIVLNQDSNLIDPKILLENIFSFLKHKKNASLDEILQKYPLQSGLAELLQYYFLSDKIESEIVDNQTDKIVLNKEKNREIEIPKLIFSK